mgnify:FL=1|jgi:hypothetical protein|tara:strand:+ start:794 stop:967 length:174 start_codon:yes stop_codon:yes gene_type:complete
MPNTVNVEENIKRILDQIDQMTREVLRLEGSLRVFRELADSGIKEVEIPDDQQVKET